MDLVVDPALVKAAQAGDHDAMVTLLRDIEVYVYRTAFYIVGNEQDALDASQESLLRIYSRINSYEEKALFKTWVHRIVTNICIDHFRRRKPTVSIDEHDMVFPTKDDVELESLSTFVAKDIEEAISKLPDHHRAVVVLRYIQDLTYKEIAEALDLPLNTVKSYLFRSRKQLQKLLHDYREGGVRG